MGRPLTPAEAAAALRRHTELEQFVSLAEGRVTYLTASRGGPGFRLRVHLVHDQGTEDSRDISEFAPVDVEESGGEGVVVAESLTPEEVIAAAADHGGAGESWVNQGMAADDYWRAKQG